MFIIIFFAVLLALMLVFRPKVVGILILLIIALMVTFYIAGSA
ncbi:hypothetical protein [Bradyrhizobium sp. DASA03007]